MMHARRREAEPLVPKGHPRGPADLRLVAVPPAGAGPNNVAGWTAIADARTEMLFVRLPGRETRFSEPPLEDARIAARLVADAVQRLPPRPTVLLGHSMGALVGYLAATALVRRGAPHLCGLVVSGLNPPDAEDLSLKVDGLSDAEFLSLLESLGGLPDEVSANRELVELMMPLLRADFRLVETFEHGAVDPLPVPIATVSGTQDRLAPPALAGGWRRCAAAGFYAEVHGGNHFAISARDGIWTDAVRRALTRLLPERARPAAQGRSAPAPANCNT